MFLLLYFSIYKNTSKISFYLFLILKHKFLFVFEENRPLPVSIHVSIHREVLFQLWVVNKIRPQSCEDIGKCSILSAPKLIDRKFLLKYVHWKYRKKNARKLIKEDRIINTAILFITECCGAIKGWISE